MKSGLLAAEFIAEKLANDSDNKDTSGYTELFKNSWAFEELDKAKNFSTVLHKFGNLVGGGYNWFEQNILGRSLPLPLKDSTPDYATLKPASQCKVINYPKPDGVLTFDRLSSVFLSNTNHEEDQPVHLQLADPSIPLQKNLSEWAEPAQRYCPAGVYEIVESDNEKQFRINAQNCVHCKTCDIKDPSQNITWVAPEGGGGPNYPNM
jgi:electron-transferring-flavoprotein dehydrogenase